MHVLVADDDRIAATLVARTIREWEYDVTVVSDGAAACRHLESSSVPTLAILDWMMPEMDGVDVCRQVRHNLPLANAYLILLTSLESRSHVVAGLEAGANDFVSKPFDPEELRARFNVGVRVLALQEKLQERVAELQDALSKVKQLRGLLPICSYCKRIRGDDQYWQQVESYIADHTEAQFSHGICPPCLVNAERELEEYQRTRKRKIS